MLPWQRGDLVALNDSLANYADGELITNVNDAPLGFSCIGSNGTNSPFPAFWCTILTMRGGSNNSYKQQIAFPWANNSSTKIAYRVYDNGTWRSWNYFDTKSATHNLSLASGLTMNGTATLQVVGDVAIMHLNFWKSSALSSGTQITTLPSTYTYSFPGNYAVPVMGSSGTVCTFNVTTDGKVMIGTELAANAHVDVLMIGRAV